MPPTINLDSNSDADESVDMVSAPCIPEDQDAESFEQTLRKSSRLQDKPQKHWNFKQYGTDFVYFAKAEKRFLGLHANSTSISMKAVLTEKPMEPKTAKQARQSAYATEWEQAMQDELNAFQRLGTSVRIPLKDQTAKVKGKKHLSNCWVFKVKPLVDSTNLKPYKFKACLVIKGYEQKYGEDFQETWASVATMASLRVLVAISAKLGKQIYQMDVKNAFLNAELDETIFTVLREGFDDGSGDVLLLRKSLYGLKQSPRQWFLCIDEKLKSIGFKPSGADQNLYLRRDCILLLYVDNIWHIPLSDAITQEIREALESWFAMTWMGEAKHFLGIDLHYLEDGSIGLSQQSYVEEILERFGMENSRPAKTPLLAGVNLPPIPPDASPANPADKLMYQRIVGSLMYAMVATRSDLAFAVSAVGQFASNPQKDHWNAINHILRYLRGSAEYTLVYSEEGTLAFAGYTDADWGGNLPDRRSTSGNIFTLGNTAISWTSTRQKSVALSSTEAEYMASCTAAQEAIWLRRMLQDIQDIFLVRSISELPSTTLFMDNQSAMALTKNPEYRKRTKHIEIAYHFVRECVASGKISVEYISTDDMTVDVMTKALPQIKHEKHIRAMGLGPVSSAKCGEN
jgi:hypothetical protein